jgi:hypothetical protein
MQISQFVKNFGVLFHIKGSISDQGVRLIDLHLPAPIISKQARFKDECAYHIDSIGIIVI